MASCLPLINSQRCKLLDNDRLVNQLTNLERRVGRGTGKDSIDHPSGAHDDLANAAAGAIVSASQKPAIKISDETLAAFCRPLGPRRICVQF